MISDDDLLLYLLNDGLAADERAAIIATLAEDAALRARLETLARDWQHLVPTANENALPTLPVDVAARLHAQLDRVTNAPSRPAVANAIASPAKSNPPSRPWWQWGAMVMASVVATTIGVAMFRNMHESREPTMLAAGPDVNLTSSGSTGRRIESAVRAKENADRFERSLKWYLVETNQQLASLRGLTPNERGAVVERVLAQNRLYISAAERADEPRSARNLRALAPVIETLGQSEDPIEFESGLAQLGFEMKVIQARLGLNAPPAERQQTRMLAL